MRETKQLPWAFLDKYRGKSFSGEWPTLPEMFKITVERFGERNCFTDFYPEHRTFTYNEVLGMIETLADWLYENGIRKGDKVAVTGKNSPEWATVYFATLFCGGTIVPIDHALHEKETENLLNTAEPKIFFVDEEKYDYFVKNSKIKIMSISKAHEDTYVFNLKPSKSHKEEREENKAAENDLAALLFTSGTTGNPKGVMLSHKNLVSDCYIAQTNLTIYETDVFYALLPLHHSYTMQAVLIESLSVGAEVVFGKSLAVTRMLRELKEGKITMLLGVPLLFNKLLAGILKGIRAKGPIVYGFMRGLMGLSYGIKKVFRVNPGKKLFKPVLEKASLGDLRIAICGGGPLAPSIFRVYNEMGVDFIQGYGLTETSPIIALNPMEHFKVDSVGRYFAPWMEMRVDNPDERGIGEIQIKGPMVMRGYYKMPEETQEMFTEDGWFKTGDLGSLDDEKYLYLAGRAKNMIVTEGGKNVFPEEIENAFQLYTDIDQITVQGYVMKSDTKSEGIEALIYASDTAYSNLKLERGKDDDDAKVAENIQEIVNTVNKTLLPYARITKVTMLKEPLEMTSTKKVKRNYNKK